MSEFIHNNKCKGWDVLLNGTTSVPKSVLRYTVDKVRKVIETEVHFPNVSYVQN